MKLAATVWELALAEVHENVRQTQEDAYGRLRCADVRLMHGKATLESTPDTLLCTKDDGDSETLAFRKLLVASGTRPIVEPYLTAFEEITLRTWRLQTSDDFFTDPSPPGKTLIVGGSYVALELAPIVSGLGFPVPVMIRSRPLRGFDARAADRLVTDLIMKHKVRVVAGECPARWCDNLDGTVTVRRSAGDEGTYRTVVLAIGRAVSPIAPLIADLVTRGATIIAGRVVMD